MKLNLLKSVGIAMLIFWPSLAPHLLSRVNAAGPQTSQASNSCTNLIDIPYYDFSKQNIISTTNCLETSSKFNSSAGGLRAVIQSPMSRAYLIDNKPKITEDDCYVINQYRSAERSVKILSEGINDRLRELTPFKFTGDLTKGVKITFYEIEGEAYDTHNHGFIDGIFNPKEYRFEISAKATPKDSQNSEEQTGGLILLRRKFR